MKRAPDMCRSIFRSTGMIHDNRFAGEACNLLFMTIDSSRSVLSIVLMMQGKLHQRRQIYDQNHYTWL